MIIEIDVQGAQKIKQHTQFKQHHIFIAPPSLDVLAQRLQKRDTETSEIMERRLAHATEEINQQHLFDSVITNDTLTETVTMVDNIILNLTKESV